MRMDWGSWAGKENKLFGFHLLRSIGTMFYR